MDREFSSIRRIGAVLTIFVTTAGKALAETALTQSSAAQTAASQSRAAEPAAVSAIGATPKEVALSPHGPNSKQNENSYRATFPDNGFGMWWVGD
jgi:hypothetical protein